MAKDSKNPKTHPDQYEWGNFLRFGPLSKVLYKVRSQIPRTEASASLTAQLQTLLSPLQSCCKLCFPVCLKHGGFHILLPTVLNRLQGRAWHILRGNNLLKVCRPTTASAMESHPGQPYARPSCFMLNRHSHPFKAQHVLSLNTEKFKDLPPV